MWYSKFIKIAQSGGTGSTSITFEKAKNDFYGKIPDLAGVIIGIGQNPGSNMKEFDKNAEKFSIIYKDGSSFTGTYNEIMDNNFTKTPPTMPITPNAPPPGSLERGNAANRTPIPAPPPLPGATPRPGTTLSLTDSNGPSSFPLILDNFVQKEKKRYKDLNSVEMTKFENELNNNITYYLQYPSEIQLLYEKIKNGTFMPIP